MILRKGQWNTLGLLLVLGAVATGCVEGRPAPDPTEMAAIKDDLTFAFGDDEICQSFQSQRDFEVTCDVVRNPEGAESFQLAKSYPTATVVLQPFAIDIHEVTNVQYEYCVEAGPCTELKGFNAANITDYYRNTVYDDHPVLNVTWEQAEVYCNWVGKRLPTQFEWERVAGGGGDTFAEKRRYPWAGDTDVFESCNNGGTGGPVIIAACGADRDPFAVTQASGDEVTEGGTTIYGLAGNVSEWVMDFRDEDFTCAEDLPASCPDCWNCSTADDVCFQRCYACDTCLEDDTCYALCKAEVADLGTRGYSVCFEYQEPLYCAVNAQGESECCLGNFGSDGGTDCFSATAPDQYRAFRGGSYLTTATQTCTVRSGDRAQGALSDDPQQRVGFRCARSL